MLGTSDGRQYDSALDYYLGGQPDASYHKELSDKGSDSSADTVDRDHHVPLVASALMDGEGKMYGLAVDHRVPPHPEYDQFLHIHEAAELPHMKNLVDAGMNPTEAYHEAHDKIATPTETAAVRAHAARLGQDPDQYLDKYKEYWREAAKVAAEPSDRERHPDAHTTKYGLDEAEGAYKVAMAGEGDEPTLLTGQPAEPQKGSVEGSEHDKAIEQPFAMTRMLGGSRGTPVMPAANENLPPNEWMKKYWKEPEGEPAMTEGLRDQLKMTKEQADELLKANPDLTNYAKALNAQAKGKFQSQDVKNRRAHMHVVDPNSPQPKSTTDQLRDWFKPK